MGYFNLASYFYDISNKHKDLIALRYIDKNVSYDELNKLSNKIANFLLSKGVKTYDVVGIFKHA
jgi:D-alanine--poly(phosphoribitol) ligase subunit 1